jgi:hypothetical protein
MSIHFQRSAILLVAVFMAAAVCVMPGCRKKAEVTYSQATPALVIESMVKMIEQGDVARLPDLVYADSKEFRIVMNRLGALLERMRDLSIAVANRFPAEAASIREQLKDGRGLESLTKITGGLPTGARSTRVDVKLGPKGAPAVNVPVPANDAASREARRDAVQELLDQLMADPFSLLGAYAKRLTTVEIDDTQVAVLFDGRPVPPLGLTMKKENDAWFIVLPTKIPGAEQYLPETRAEWSILGSLIKALENSVGDLRDDVKNGKVMKMEQLAEKAGEKAFVPVAIIGVVYAKEMDARNQRQKAMAALRTRLTRWATARQAAGEDAQTTEKLLQLVNAAAVEGLDKAVRLKVQESEKNKLPVFDKLSDGELQGLIENWLDQRNIRISIGLPADPVALDKAAAKLMDAVNVQK